MISIEININNIYFFIDTIHHKITINNKEKNITKEEIDNLLRIIRTWKKSYSDSKKIDAETFNIKINTNEGIDIIKGNGDYPENYIAFKKWIGDIYE